jgi:uncharacterized membrane protein
MGMHVILMIVAGFALLAILMLTAKGDRPKAIKRFIPLWLGISVANMIIGTAYAGYTLMEEAIVATAIFGIPLATALIIGRMAKA